MKKILIFVAFLLIVLFINFSFSALINIVSFLGDNPVWILILPAAVIVQLFGHLFRAKRTKLVIDQATPSSLKFQFSTLSTGYLFNAFLPLKLGEIIRSLLIARRLRISFLYTFTAIVIERMIDIIFLSVIVILGSLFIGGQLTGSIVILASIALTLSASVIVIIILLKQENKYLLSLVYNLSRLFNTTIRNSIRFKVWSLIFGLQSFFNNKNLIIHYLLYATISWLFYFASVIIIAVSIFNFDNIFQVVVVGVSTYIISSPSLTPFDPNIYQQLTQLVPTSNVDSMILFTNMIWAVLVLPMALLGGVSLVIYKTAKKADLVEMHHDSYTNKLLRHDDISQEFPAFLDTYFKNYGLSRILHKIEVQGELSLVKFFKGGSDAITVLALKNGNLFVKKIVPYELTSRLKVQYDWLKRFEKSKMIVDVIAEHKADEYYAIDLAYDPSNIPLFEYIHSRSIEQSKKAIDNVWDYIFKNIYTLKKESIHEVKRDEYFQDRLVNKINKALSQDEKLREVVKFDRILINGEQYDNFYSIIQKIKSNNKSWSDIATYRESDATHGDLTIDNILINTTTEEPFIIDPSDDNQIKGPVIDFARHTQSLAMGYEFLNSDDESVGFDVVDGLASINYKDHRSASYMQLCEYFIDVVARKYLTDSENKTLLFHAGLLYGRMLAHRVFINPDNTLKYYAVCIVLLNRFYRQYEK